MHKTNPIKIISVFGTRPEIIKMATVVKRLEEHAEKIKSIVCVTAQHREMIDPLLRLFDIEPDYDLNIMHEKQSLEYITITILNELGKVIKEEKPNYLLVQGDTTTSMAAGLTAFYQNIKIAHIEAGLRTWNKLHPYPEEVNRKIIDSVTDLYFAHSEKAKQNLIAEGVDGEKVEITGNTVVDALLYIAGRNSNLKGTVLENILSDKKKIILLTAHRRESFGESLFNICNAIKEIALRYPSDICIVFPVHLNPIVQKSVYSILSDVGNVLLTEPLAYPLFVQLMKKSYLILTDSGGLQEEAPSFGTPVLILREVTERPEVVEAGVAKIVGTNSERIIENTIKLLEDRTEYKRMSRAINPYGDGKASERIVGRLLRELRINE